MHVFFYLKKFHLFFSFDCKKNIVVKGAEQSPLFIEIYQFLDQIHKSVMKHKIYVGRKLNRFNSFIVKNLGNQTFEVH